MNVEWYLRTDLGRQSEKRGAVVATSTVEVLRSVLEAHAQDLAGRPFSAICIHVMPAQSEHSFDSRMEAAQQA